MVNRCQFVSLCLDLTRVLNTLVGNTLPVRPQPNYKSSFILNYEYCLQKQLILLVFSVDVNNFVKKTLQSMVAVLTIKHKSKLNYLFYSSFTHFIFKDCIIIFKKINLFSG